MPPWGSDLSWFGWNLVYGFIVLVLPIGLWALMFAGLAFVLAGRLQVKVGRTLTALFAASFALVGGVAGDVAGASLESIVGAALAALLGLVSSLLTYLFGKEALAPWRPVIPIAIIALVSSALVGLVVGGSRRTQLLDKQQERDKYKFYYENIYAPAERERRMLYYRKCMTEQKDTLDAFNNCADMDKPG